MTQNKQIAILNSGGMDSYLLWYMHRTETPMNVFVDVGQKYHAKERNALNRIQHLISALQGAPFLSVYMPGPNLAKFEHASGIIPLRNAYLIMTAAQHYSEILLGVVRDEINSDKSPEFLESMQRMLDISWREQYWTTGRTFKIRTPLREFSKAVAVQHYIAAGGPIKPLLATVSCYSAGEWHCGACPSCFKRWVALELNDLSDLEVWRSHPAVFGYSSGAYKKACTGVYAVGRADEIVMAYRKLLPYRLPAGIPIGEI